jgi:arabinan endo-1,5-alpha-L-arabinosidase
MNFKFLFHHCQVLALLLVLIKLTNSNLSAQTFQPCHDPSSPIYSEGKWWIFTTGQGIYVMNSPILTGHLGWKTATSVFSGKGPSWIQKYVPGFTGFFWAPEIISSSDSFLCYYACSTFGSQNSCIGLASAKSLGGPWKDLGVVVYTNSGTSENAIDPAIFNGYLIYGSFFGGIRMAKLDSLTGKPINSTRIAVASGDCEASNMTYDSGYYYLWINRGACCKGIKSTYHVQVGRSANITGPFIDKVGKNLNSGGGSNIVTSRARYIGPGCMGFNGSYAVYHFYDNNDNGNPKLFATTFGYNNGWPVVSSVDGTTFIEAQNQTNSNFQIFPNPFKNEFTLQLMAIKTNVPLMSVYNSAGIEIFSGKVNSLLPGLNSIKFSTSQLNIDADGLYLIQLKTEDNTERFRVVKEK